MLIRYNKWALSFRQLAAHWGRWQGSGELKPNPVCALGKITKLQVLALAEHAVSTWEFPGAQESGRSKHPCSPGPARFCLHPLSVLILSKTYPRVFSPLLPGRSDPTLAGTLACKHILEVSDRPRALCQPRRTEPPGPLKGCHEVCQSNLPLPSISEMLGAGVSGTNSPESITANYNIHIYNQLNVTTIYYNLSPYLHLEIKIISI